MEAAIAIRNKEKGKELPIIQRFGCCLPLSTQKHSTSSFSLTAMVRLVALSFWRGSG
ncbi:MAG: hypothetical protein ICV53_04785 [Flavisolibacter sp.]|nr:hypothetical protein [Flavisolibacter sp.]